MVKLSDEYVTDMPFQRLFMDVPTYHLLTVIMQLIHQMAPP